jgi:hypothetical protein
MAASRKEHLMVDQITRLAPDQDEARLKMDYEQTLA